MFSRLFFGGWGVDLGCLDVFFLLFFFKWEVTLFFKGRVVIPFGLPEKPFGSSEPGRRTNVKPVLTLPLS